MPTNVDDDTEVCFNLIKIDVKFCLSALFDRNEVNTR